MVINTDVGAQVDSMPIIAACFALRVNVFVEYYITLRLFRFPIIDIVNEKVTFSI